MLASNGCGYCIHFNCRSIFTNATCKECMGNTDILADKEKYIEWITNKPNFKEKEKE